MTTPQAVCHDRSPRSASAGEVQMLQGDDALQQEIQRLAAINEELLARARPDGRDVVTQPGDANELALLRRENAELRARLAEFESGSPTAAGEGQWSERQKEYEALLEEKSEVIRSLYLKIQGLQEGGAAPAGTGAVMDGSDMEPLRKELEEQRRQLVEDEESLLEQMRQMEMALSKDRAELARQRNEVQRLHNDLNHEIELASRDPGLRERLVALQRLQGEVAGRKHVPSPAPHATHPAETTADPTAQARKKSSGLLRRIFGR